MAKATLMQVRDFFGMKTTEMRDEWTKGNLTQKDKDELMEGIGNGTLTY